MPTGYTDFIKDGTTFEQFALNCAKAFGACITMRDLPSGAEIPEQFEASPYHVNQLAEARAQLAFYEGFSFEEAERAARNEYADLELLRNCRLSENRSQLERYRAMLDQVRLWTPPTAEHDELGDFMLSQLKESIKFDDSTEYLSKPTPVLTAVEWLEGKKVKALADIEYHKKEYAEELKRTADRNEWLRVLRESLK